MHWMGEKLMVYLIRIILYIHRDWNIPLENISQEEKDWKNVKPVSDNGDVLVA
jgi:hypothetical protein